jgi:integrase
MNFLTAGTDNGTLPVNDFTPVHLDSISDNLVQYGYKRKLVNFYVRLIRGAFERGVRKCVVRPEVHYALRTVTPLQQEHTDAHEYREVLPVSLSDVEKTVPFLPSVIADMVWVQYLCGMRCQDVRNLRPCDIDRSRPDGIWVYRPYTHKTKMRGKSLRKAIGKKAQDILTPYLERLGYQSNSFIFSPAESMRRCGNVQPSQADRSKSNPKRVPKEQYGDSAYSCAIARACKKAGVPHWFPNQLRHAMAQHVRDNFGIEYAQSFLGHSSAKTTEIYAECDFAKAITVAKEVG